MEDSHQGLTRKRDTTGGLVTDGIYFVSVGYPPRLLLFAVHQPRHGLDVGGHPPFGVFEPVFLNLHAQTVCQPGHEVETAGDQDRGQNLLVVQSEVAQPFDVRLLAARWVLGQFNREIQHTAGLFVQVGLGVIVHNVAG